MPGFDSTFVTILWFLAGTAVIALAGTRMAYLADRLADRTGLGEAVTGALLLGVSTSLPGITASITAAAGGYPTMAVANAMGGIAAQTAFLAIADIFHRQANLEHAAASVANLTFSALLVGLLTIALMGMTGPGLTIAHVDPTTIVLFVAYGFGLRLAFISRTEPMWRPRRTPHTLEDRPSGEAVHESLSSLLIRFAAAAAAVLVGGVTVARAAGALVELTGVSESVVGGVFTAVSTSLPELITTVAAVRHGALTLAVSDIVGGNAFDVLFVAVADFAYLEGSLFAAAGPQAMFLTALAALLNVVILLGLLQRQPKGPAGIGFESVLVLVLYAAGIAIMTGMT